MPRSGKWVALAAASIALLLVLMPAGSARAQSGGSGTPLRQVDWLAVLSSESGVAMMAPEACLPVAAPTPIICIDIVLAQVPAATSVDGSSPPDVAGFVPIGSILYGDLDGDGLEEAVLPIESGGTGGTLGFLLYQQASARPHLLFVGTGYKMGLAVGGGLLTESDPFYFGFEGNCCPTALWRTQYQLVAGTLQQYSQPALFLLSPSGETRTLPSVATVVAYYRALDQGSFEDAYALLSPGAQATLPFAAWKAGFAGTRSIAVDASVGATSDKVNVTITSSDATAGGGTIMHTFQGSWTVVPAETAPLGLLLDSASIRLVPQ